MKRDRWYQLYANEWLEPLPRGFKLACCDCGLVHKVNFRVVDGRVQFQMTQSGKATAAQRRGKK